jgi:hypothetical protein
LTLYMYRSSSCIILVVICYAFPLIGKIDPF